jgi:hypothetical protein
MRLREKKVIKTVPKVNFLKSPLKTAITSSRKEVRMERLMASIP